jgi:hypothetical protein
MDKDLAAALFGAALIIAAQLWSKASGEGANIGAGVVVLIGLVIAIVFCTRFVRKSLAAKKK